MIPLTVALNFGETVIYSALWLPNSSLAIMPVPEAPMHKDCQFNGQSMPSQVCQEYLSGEFGSRRNLENAPVF